MRAWRWHRLLEEGRYPSIKALTRAEAVLDGRLPKGGRLEDLVRRALLDGGGG